MLRSDKAGLPAGKYIKAAAAAAAIASAIFLSSCREKGDLKAGDLYVFGVYIWGNRTCVSGSDIGGSSCFILQIQVQDSS